MIQVSNFNAIGLKMESSGAKKPQNERWYKSFSRWIPTSESILDDNEAKILSYVKTSYKGIYVEVGPLVRTSNAKSKIISANGKALIDEKPNRIWTLIFNKESNNVPIVLIHGFCSSSGLWALNIDSLAKNRPVISIDLLGFGKSSRPKFSSDSMEVEIQQVEALEIWRQKMGLERLILMGHSMGGFLSAAYSLKYPKAIVQLILVDPWGIPEANDPYALSTMPTARRIAMKTIWRVSHKLNALCFVRAAGPIGPGIIGRIRPDIVEKFIELNQNGKADVTEYIYHCNAKKPTGEEAFRKLMNLVVWAKHPIAPRLRNLDISIPLAMICGAQTWLPQIHEKELYNLRHPSSSNIFHIIEDAGHHVYADNRSEFNEIIEKIGKSIDEIYSVKTI